MNGYASGLALIDGAKDNSEMGYNPGQGLTEIPKEYVLCKYNRRGGALTKMCMLRNVQKLHHLTAL